MKKKEAEKKRRAEAEAAGRSATQPRSKKVAIFYLDILHQHCTPIPSFNGDAELKDPDFKQPWILTNSEILEGIMKSTTGKLANTLQGWVKQFPNHKICKENNIVNSPLLESFGAGELRGIWEKLLPTSALMDAKTPSLIHLTKDDWLYGFAEHYTDMAFEPGLMGATYIHLSGSCLLVLMRTAAVVEYVSRTYKFNSKKVSMPAFSECVRAMTNKDVKEMLETGMFVYYGTLATMTCLHVPAGWVVGITVNSGAPAAGIKKNCVARVQADNWKAAAQADTEHMDVPATSLQEADSVLDRLVL